MRAALYARVSTRDKDQDPETQLLILRAWAARQHLETVEYIDYASGRNLNRPGWISMMNEIRANNSIDVIVVLRLDRAFRSVLDMSLNLQSFKDRGIRFASATQDLDTGSATGQLLVNLLGSFGEFEAQLTSERIKEGLARSPKKSGRPKIVSDRRLFDAFHRLGVRGAARELGISPAAVSKRVNQTKGAR